MIEEVDTNSNFGDKVIPDGPHHFKVIAIRKVKNSYAFSLAYDDGASGEILLFANMIGPLLKALGCAEGSAPGKYVLNTDITTGGEFDATIYEEKGYKRIKDIKGSGVGY
jgi:hypothetical protein